MKRRLLLVEDSELDRRWMLEQLQKRFRTIDVIEASSISAAERAIVEHGCDIIITDLLLPDSSVPQETITSLRERAPGVPIIAVTGMSDADSPEVDVVNYGASHLLFKEDIRANFSHLVGPLVTAVKMVHGQESTKLEVRSQLNALAEKVWADSDRISTTDGRLTKVETDVVSGLEAVRREVAKVGKQLDDRGGFEDRLIAIEGWRQRIDAERTWVAGVLAAAAAAAIGGFFWWS